jgi:hypothetical protein
MKESPVITRPFQSFDFEKILNAGAAYPRPLAAKRSLIGAADMLEQNCALVRSAFREIEYQGSPKRGQELGWSAIRFDLKGGIGNA